MAGSSGRGKSGSSRARGGGSGAAAVAAVASGPAALESAIEGRPDADRLRANFAARSSSEQDTIIASIRRFEDNPRRLNNFLGLLGGRTSQSAGADSVARRTSLQQNLINSGMSRSAASRVTGVS